MKKIASLFFAVLMFASCVTVTVGAAEGFADVAEDRWSAASIKYAVKNGYMKGVGGDRFDPEGSLTRAMVATVLWRREGEPAPTTPSGFSDIPAGEWYADAVAWAKETGVVKGITDKTFEPDGLITREQLATMLFRFSSSAPVSVPERADLTPFSDDEKVSEWASEPLGWAVEAGLIKGTDGNRLAPEGDATREQFAAIIERYDGAFRLEYNNPVVRSHYTEKPYPLVTDADIYVSTDGNDENPGAFDSPLATFAGAVAKVREVKAAKAEGDIVVAFRAGDYRLDGLTLTAEDSGDEGRRIVYCAYGDGPVNMTAGVRVYRNELEELNDDDRTLFREKAWDHVMKIDLSDKVADGELTRSSEAFTGDYGRLDAARYPNRNPRGEEVYLERIAESVRSGQMKISHMTSRFRGYHTWDGAVIIGCVGDEYWKTVFPVTDFDPETGIISYKIIGPQYGLEPYARSVYFLNISEELDFAHEYYIDPERKALYLYDPDSESYSVSVGEHFAVVDGADRLTFRGLDFSGCTGDGFVINADGIVFDRCSVTGIGGRYGLKVSGVDFRMQDSEFAYTAGCGMWFDSNRDVNDLVPTGPYIDNCLIHHAGQKWKNLQNPGIRIKRAVGAVVSHCEIYNTPSAAISFGYVAEGGEERAIECIFEYNYLHDVANDLDDMGAVYTGRSFVNRDNEFRYNVIAGTSDSHTSFGLYLDDGVAAQKAYGNIFYDCGTLGFVNSGGQYADLHDNVCVRTSPLWGEPTNAMAATAKYYYWVYDEDSEHPTAWNSGNFRILYNTLKKRPAPGDEYYGLWLERWPELYEVLEDYDDVENPNCPASPGFCSVYNNYAIGYCHNVIDEPVERFAVKFGNNSEFTIDENPIFVNPTTGDYRIREGVDFPDIHFEEVGRY